MQPAQSQLAVCLENGSQKDKKPYLSSASSGCETGVGRDGSNGLTVSDRNPDAEDLELLRQFLGSLDVKIDGKLQSIEAQSESIVESMMETMELDGDATHLQLQLDEIDMRTKNIRNLNKKRVTYHALLNEHLIEELESALVDILHPQLSG